MRVFLIIAGWMVLLAGCSAGKSSFSPATKYSPATLQKDYAIYQQILEEAHPGLYWYTSKDSMDYYFRQGAARLKDSLTETEFRRVLTYVTTRINCGHTSIRASRRFTNFNDSTRLRQIFPLSLKCWQDTAVVAANLNRTDSILQRGTVITSINGKSMQSLVDTMFNYIPTDGYNATHKFQVLSNRGYFGSLYSSLFGFPGFYDVEYLDSTGAARHTLIKPYQPRSDTFNRGPMIPGNRVPQPSRKERKHLRRNNMRLLKIDSVSRVAMMDLNSFGRGYGLKAFFRRSFKTLEKNKIGHLIIDVRGNGGGSVTNSTLITRFLADHKFKVGDSLYAIAKKKKYSRHIQNDFLNRMFMTFFARRKRDGYYHFSYFERHYFKPKKRNHFDGKVYILTGGNSFSATTLFASTLIGQENVLVVGEETGGGAYGNSAWLIPDVTLPGTKVRFRLPLFRLVIDKDLPRNGRGVQPEVLSVPTIADIKRGADFKVEKVMELIKADKEGSK